jgi:hypothetical protein
MLPPVLPFPKKAQVFLKSQLLAASLVIPISNFYQLNLIKFASFNDDSVWGGGSSKRTEHHAGAVILWPLILILRETQYF